ncbi:ABC transporter permease subunit [Sediminibacillus dalangtanensis]|uniref:ABC transporter permease subunit n=1 Tax=Sediminibacillus dalangtanensis TaxID=2729421 RepID=A0ABX7VUN1_9BACI|nr:ABC transporter permease [Sediminibacillus dalangtanensis]QTM98052.1 ABC transporter permease subunit [Sediminibacillus dalangtanensis]
MKQLKTGWRPVIAILLLLVIWETAGRAAEIPSWLLPTPSQIWQEAVAGWGDYKLHLFSTIKLTLIGFLLGTSIGITASVCLHLLPKLRETVYPLMILSQNIPIIVLAPLLVIWFGFGILPKLIIITLVCFFPIAVATLDGFRQTSPELLHYLKMAGADKRQIFWKLEWPTALPSLFSGLKISATYSVMGAVISEWLGAQQGIGVYMTLASSSFRTDRVFVAIFFIMVLCLLFFVVIITIEKRVIRWKKKGAEQHG